MSKKSRNSPELLLNSSNFFDIFKYMFSKNRKLPITAEETIMFEKIYKNGMCKIDKKTYNIVIEFEDINYKLVSTDNKINILENWSKLLNSFNVNMRAKLMLINKKSSFTEELENIKLNEIENFKELREEFNEYLKGQLLKGNAGIKHRKFLFINIQALDEKTALSMLNKIELNIMNNLNTLRTNPKRLNGMDRLELLYLILKNTDDQLKIKEKEFWEKSELNTNLPKKLVSPEIIDFSNKKEVKVVNNGNKTYFKTTYLILEKPQLEDEFFIKLADLNIEQIICIDFYSLGVEKGKKIARSKIADVNLKKTNLQKKAVAGNYDMDMLPPELQHQAKGIQLFYDELAEDNEKFFMTTITLTVFANTKKKLESNLLQVTTLAEEHDISFKEYHYQEKAFHSFIPVGHNLLSQKRNLTTKALAIFVPFNTKELFETSGIYYGLNKLSNNMIVANRKRLKNPNGLLLGLPGGGKSFSAKREILNVFLTTEDEILIVDPEGEYGGLTKALNGEEIVLSLETDVHFNPFDIGDEYDGKNPISIKIDEILSIMETILNQKDGITPLQKSSIERSVNKIYMNWMDNPIEENIPTLSDFRDALKSLNTNVSNEMAEALYVYTDGSQNIFNHKSNINMKSRVICFNLKELPNNLKELGMIIIQDFIWSKVAANRKKSMAENKKIYTWVYFDEIHKMLRNEQTAVFTVDIWKRFRKWLGIPTGMTQNVKDFLLSPLIETIFDTTDFYMLLSQGAGDRDILAEKLEISDEQLKYIVDVAPGEGLIKCSSTIIPFSDKVPKDTLMYKLMNTSGDS